MIENHIDLAILILIWKNDKFTSIISSNIRLTLINIPLLIYTIDYDIVWIFILKYHRISKGTIAFLFIFI